MLTDLVAPASLLFGSAGAAVVCYDAVRRPSLYRGLVASTFLGGSIMCYHIAFASFGGYDPHPTVTAMSLATSASLGTAAFTLAAGPWAKFGISFKSLLALGGAVLTGTLALTADPALLKVVQRYDDASSCMVLILFGAALLSAYRRQFTMIVLTVLTTALLVACNALWYGGDPLVKILTSATNFVLVLLAVGAQPQAGQKAGASVVASAV